MSAGVTLVAPSLTRKDLDGEVISTCHPAGGLTADFDAVTGALKLYCHRCGKHVANIAVQK